jgi:hypothetical protein
MADEITVNLRMRVVKGFLVHEDSVSNQLVSMSGSVSTGGSQAIGTNAEVLQMNDVSTAGYAFFRNLSTTNFLELGTGTTTFVAFAKLKAGEAACLRLSTSAPSARANTAPVNLQYYILAD